MIYFFNVGHTVSVTKVPDMRICQNEHNVLLNFPRYLSILLSKTSKTDNNALDIYNLKLRKT
jgi:pyrroloquinoline quinone (PQQ) biosynthesis protein C